MALAASSARFQQRAGAFALSAGVAMDLRLGWDLGLEADQIKSRPVSPMCLAFSQLQALNTKPDRLAELLEQVRPHLEFACSLAESQVKRGGRVLFEYLWLRCWRSMACAGSAAIKCQFGMTSVDDAVNVGPARKATGFMTNDEYIAEAVDRRCFGGHDHVQLLNGRAKACEK